MKIENNLIELFFNYTFIEMRLDGSLIFLGFVDENGNYRNFKSPL